MILKTIAKKYGVIVLRITHTNNLCECIIILSLLITQNFELILKISAEEDI